ncbi:sugar ABC transporter substrate-binding protein [Cohnella endophytica]|uniref:Sugar ABC transporter substrate-binding protein n=1 Tax=Cohnella endophytica TaxID=2419778 RepID=A0A494XJF6_9BACL|nr:sugar ABC transporter substrate-binding protein [Cohnella endophytica]RKP49851.1 sugar ABC transporter substrate-binding protein [Cohnella endophytica]
MLNMKKAAGFVAVPVLISMLAACGSNDSSSNGAKESASKGVQKVKLTMIESLSSPKRTEFLQQSIKEFEAQNPNITVELITPPLESADNKINTMLSAKQTLDILEVRDITVKQFVNNGYLENLDSYASQWPDYGTLTPGALTMAKDVDNKAYYIPYGIYQRQLFYRKDLFAEKGLEVPKTWEELYEVGKKLTDPAKNKYGYSYRGGAGGEQYITQIVQDYNGSNVNPKDSVFNNDGSSIFSTPGAVDALEMLKKIYKEVSPPDSANWAFAEQVQGFTSGTTAMLIQDPDTIDTVATSLDASQWGTAPLPTGPSGVSHFVLGAAGWGMTNYSEHKEEAWKLISFLSSPEQNLKFAKTSGVIPIHTTAGSDEFFKTGAYAPYIEMGKQPEKYVGVKPFTNYQGYALYKKNGTEKGQAFIMGRTGAADFAKEFDEFWKKEKANDKG